MKKSHQKKFDGDIHKAIEYVYRNYASINDDLMDQIYGEFTKEELDYVMEVIVRITKERAGDKNFKKIQRAAA